MSEAIEPRVVGPGDTARMEPVWDLKETIRAADGMLAQSRRFFRFQYERGTAYLYEADAPVAFAVVRRDGYLSLLGVHPDHRRQGLGRRLVDRVAADHGRVSCHTRVTNEGGLAFYTDRGFVVAERVEGYYRDGTDAYRLELSAEGARRLDRVMGVLEE